MKFFTTTLLLCFLIFNSNKVFAQERVKIDSLKRELAKATTATSKGELLEKLSMATINLNPAEAEQYSKQYISMAEESRDRELMARSYLYNGVRLSYTANTAEQIAEVTKFYKQSEDLARKNNLDKYVVVSLLRQSAFQLKLMDKQKAEDLLSQASSKMSGYKNDSLQVLLTNALGDVKQVKNQKIEALRLYLSALRLAEQIKNDYLIRLTYKNLGDFYMAIEDFDRTLDYYSMAMNKIKLIPGINAGAEKCRDLILIGDVYTSKKDFDMAILQYDKALSIADSIKYGTIKMNAYIGKLNVNIMRKEPEKSLAFLTSNQGIELRDYFAKFGMDQVMDQGFAIVYAEVGRMDSAAKYFKLAAPYFDNSAVSSMKMFNDYSVAKFLKKKGDNAAAIKLFLSVKDMAEQSGALEYVEESAKELDSLYRKIGDYKSASEQSSMYFLMKDSLQKINKEKEITQVEAQDEQQRLETMAKLEAEAKNRRNNIQYLGIIVGICSLFLLLILFGMLKVSARTIRMLAFFAFLMFFEFIFLVFKKNIYAVTKGEPWMDLAFMIGLAAILLPLHHWIEHKVLHYLTSRNKLTTAGEVFKTKFFGKREG